MRQMKILIHDAKNTLNGIKSKFRQFSRKKVRECEDTAIETIQIEKKGLDI